MFTLSFSDMITLVATVVLQKEDVNKYFRMLRV